MTGGDGGTGATAGAAGITAIRPAGTVQPVLEGVPTIVSDSGSTTTMTTAIALSRVHVKDPTAGITYTTPTGTELTAAFSTQPALGDSFMFTLINTGDAGAEDITMAAGASGITFIGNLVVLPAADEAEGNYAIATWLIVNTDGANAWTWYRMS